MYTVLGPIRCSGCFCPLQENNTMCCLFSNKITINFEFFALGVS